MIPGGLYRLIPTWNPATGLSGYSMHYPDVNAGGGLHSTGAGALIERSGKVREASLFFP